MTSNQLMLAFGALVEEIAPPKYHRATADEQPISRAQWLVLRERFEAMAILNMPRETSE